MLEFKGGEKDKLQPYADKHAVCGGFCHLTPISKTHQAISCVKCNLRVEFPIEIETYGQLREYFEQLFHKNLLRREE